MRVSCPTEPGYQLFRIVWLYGQLDLLRQREKKRTVAALYNTTHSLGPKSASNRNSNKLWKTRRKEKAFQQVILVERREL